MTGLQAALASTIASIRAFEQIASPGELEGYLTTLRGVVEQSLRRLDERTFVAIWALHFDCGHQRPASSLDEIFSAASDLAFTDDHLHNEVRVNCLACGQPRALVSIESTEPTVFPEPDTDAPDTPEAPL
jgi:predicted PhzF superfamily epimerase YddE/YHI9